MARLLPFDQRDIERAREFLDATAPGNHEALAALVSTDPGDHLMMHIRAVGHAQVEIQNLLRIIDRLAAD